MFEQEAIALARHARPHVPARSDSGGSTFLPGASDALSSAGAWDRASRSQAVATLQRSAGNRAVAAALAKASRPNARPATSASLSTIASTASRRPGLNILPILLPLDLEALGVALQAPRSTPAEPPGGSKRISSERGGGSRAAGYTSLPAPIAPDLAVGNPERRGNGYVAPVKPTTVGPDPPVSLYPAPGVHDIGPGAGGQERHINVTPETSEIIRRGEEEHLLDIEWARHLSYDRAAAAVNAVAAAEPPLADSPAAARTQAMDQVRQALPAQLRWKDGEDPGRPWVRAYSRLAHVTIERDQNHWHDMTSAFVLEAAEKRRLGVPEADELTRYVGGPEIGKHPSADLVRARFAELAGG